MSDVRNGLDPVDYKLIVEKPDPRFSPERNKAIVEETIKETNQFWKTEAKAIDEEMGKRIDVLSSYGTYRFNRGTKTLRDYLGKELYEKLIGEKLLQKIRIAESTNRLSKPMLQKGS